ncbi:MAG TPA: VOC family protein [Brevibacterium senegalense]|uniref:VOC family protein n=1 Tax=Brevibacterium senegalense TaxID=1033736 RepID=A0A921MCW7_9MICO|nr:VOC family protein [Brevibacterium senegalense]
MTQLTPHIWCNRTAEEAADLYTRTFRQVREIARSHYPTEDLPDFQKSFAGQVVSLELEIHGCPVGFINADDIFRPNPAAGFMVHISTAHVDDPTTYIDEIHDRLIDGGHALMPLGEYPFSPRYAWIEDRYGVSWQLFVSPDDAPPRPFLVPALLFSGQAQNRCAEAVVTYTSLFPGAEAGTVATYPEPTGPARAGDVMFSEMRLGPDGDDPTREPWVTAMDSGVEQPFTFTEGFSLMVRVRDQEEIDRLWDVLSTVPEKEACGWCCDEYGVSWQIVPEDIDEIMEIPGAHQRMLEMKKLDIAGLRGE